MKTAMILAAGRGERLKPLTDKQPKALCKVAGLSLIEHHILNLRKAGFTRVIVNHAHLGYQIRHQLQHYCSSDFRLDFAPEPPGGLETGGGILNALPLLGDKPFLSINADIFTDFPLQQLALPVFSQAHLVLVRNPQYKSKGDFGLGIAQELHRRTRDYTFSGIACYHPEAFKGLQPGRYSVISSLIDPLINKKQASGEFFAGSWFDIGAQERLDEANHLVRNSQCQTE